MVDSLSTLTDEVDEIQEELGPDPQGVYASVRVRLDILEARINNPLAPNPGIIEFLSNPVMFYPDAVTIATGSGPPGSSSLPGSLYLRQDGYISLYSYTDGYGWQPIMGGSGGGGGSQNLQSVLNLGNSAGNLQIKSLANPTLAQDAATKSYVDGYNYTAAVNLAGDVTGLASSNTIGNNVVNDAKIRQSAALSVIGRSANSIGNVGDISTTSSSNAVLRESGGVIGFGTVATGGIANSAVTYAKIQDSSAASRLLGRGAGAGAGPFTEIILGTNLSMSGNTLNAGGGGGGSQTLAQTLGLGNTTDGYDIVVTTGDVITLIDAPIAATDAVNKGYVDGYNFTAAITLTGDVNGPANSNTIDTNAVTNAKFRQSVGLSVVGRGANSTGDVADITAGTDGYVLRRNGTVVRFDYVDLSINNTTGNVSVNNNRIINLATPVAQSDAATKGYVDGYVHNETTLDKVTTRGNFTTASIVGNPVLTLGATGSSQQTIINSSDFLGMKVNIGSSQYSFDTIALTYPNNASTFYRHTGGISNIDISINTDPAISLYNPHQTFGENRANIQLFRDGDTANFGDGYGIVQFNQATVPTTNPTTNNLFVYNTGTALQTRNSAGNVVTLDGSFSLSGDVVGDQSGNTIEKIQNNTVDLGTLGAIHDGYVLTWVNSSSAIEARPPTSSGNSTLSQVLAAGNTTGANNLIQTATAYFDATDGYTRVNQHLQVGGKLKLAEQSALNVPQSGYGKLSPLVASVDGYQTAGRLAYLPNDGYGQRTLLSANEVYRYQKTTNNNTPTNALTLALADNSAYTLNFEIIGTVVSDGYVYRRISQANYHRINGGNAVLENTIIDSLAYASTGGITWDASFGLATNNLNLTLTGATGKTINWQIIINYFLRNFP